MWFAPIAIPKARAVTATRKPKIMPRLLFAAIVAIAARTGRLRRHHGQIGRIGLKRLTVRQKRRKRAVVDVGDCVIRVEWVPAAFVRFVVCRKKRRLKKGRGEFVDNSRRERGQGIVRQSQ